MERRRPGQIGNIFFYSLYPLINYYYTVIKINTCTGDIGHGLFFNHVDPKFANGGRFYHYRREKIDG